MEWKNGGNGLTPRQVRETFLLVEGLGMANPIRQVACLLPGISTISFPFLSYPLVIQ